MDPIVLTLLIAAATLALDILVVVIGGVWIVARISGTTDKLSVSVEHLSESFKDLKLWLQRVDSKEAATVERLAVVETQLAEVKKEVCK